MEIKYRNVARVEWARTAVDTFQSVCRTDDDDALCDLLCDLMHLADAEGWQLDTELSRTRGHYEYEMKHED